MEKRLMLGNGVENRITGQNLETTHQLIYLHALKSHHLSLMVLAVPKLPACCMNNCCEATSLLHSNCFEADLRISTR